MRGRLIVTRAARIATSGASRLPHGLALVAFALGLAIHAPASLQAQQPPSIVLILTDDQPYHTLDVMPRLNALIRDQGVTFGRYYVATALCGPSRATILTGLHEFHHGITGNGEAADNFDASSTIATWLHDAGYRTGLFGKYENHYDIGEGNFPAVPPGWDEWWGFAGDYFDYNISINGTAAYKGTGQADYSTYVLRDAVLNFIASTPANQPLLAYFAPYGPHEPYDTPAADAQTFDGVPWGVAQMPNYNETNVSDKPAWVRSLPLADDSTMRMQYEQKLEVLQSIDRAVEAIVNALAQAGRLDNTYIIFTSDNGFELGSHRIAAEKWTIYEESVRLPLMVRGPGIPAGLTIANRKLGSNVDLAPTIAAMAGVSPATAVDGISLLPLVLDPSTPWSRDLLLTDRGGGGKKRRFWAIRSADGWKYGEYDNGDRELYRLSTDPWEMKNVITNPTYASIVTDLSNRLAALKAE